MDPSALAAAAELALGGGLLALPSPGQLDSGTLQGLLVAGLASPCGPPVILTPTLRKQFGAAAGAHAVVRLRAHLRVWECAVSVRLADGEPPGHLLVSRTLQPIELEWQE